MRTLNAIAALSGACGLIMLAAAHHLLAGSEGAPFVMMAAIAQLSAGAAGLAIANRAGRLNLLAGAMILGGASLFALEIYLISFQISEATHMLAPIGGGTMILGWIVLAFAEPDLR